MILLKRPEASLCGKCVTIIKKVCPHAKINETELFEEVMILKEAFTEKEEIQAKYAGEMFYELFNNLGVN